jgi:hypothetical protein
VKTSAYRQSSANNGISENRHQRSYRHRGNQRKWRSSAARRRKPTSLYDDIAHRISKNNATSLRRQSSGVMAAAMASGGINGISNQRRGISWRNRQQNVKKNYGINNVRKQWQRMAKWRSAGGGIAYQTAA